MRRRASLTLVVPGRVSGGRGSVGTVHAVSGGRLGLQVLVVFVKLAVNGCLALQVLTMQPVDQLTSWPFALVVGVMAIAKQELAACRGMLSDSPAARLVTVALLDELVDARADRSEDAELLTSEPNRTRIRRAGLVDGARVHLEPVADLPGSG